MFVQGKQSWGGPGSSGLASGLLFQHSGRLQWLCAPAPAWPHPPLHSQGWGNAQDLMAGSQCRHQGEGRERGNSAQVYVFRAWKSHIRFVYLFCFIFCTRFHGSLIKPLVEQSLDAADQRSLVADVRQAVKFAASDLKGEELMPGFCLPKGERKREKFLEIKD